MESKNPFLYIRSHFAILAFVCCVFSILVEMDRHELILKWAEAAVDENVALKAEVASLKLQNESLEIRLAAASDKITSLQQFCEGETVMRRTAQEALEGVTKALNSARVELEDNFLAAKFWRKDAENLRKELMRRGADDPRKPKSPCDIAFAALDLVRNWDRDECVTDLRNQRVELLRRIDALKSGRELKMGDVMAALEKDTKHPIGTLLYALGNLREQLHMIFHAGVTPTLHPQWFQPPLSLFRTYTDEDSDEAEEGNDMDDESESSESMEEDEQ